MDKYDTGTSRRDFLRLAGTAAPAAAGAVVAAPDAAEAADAKETGGLPRTEHVRKYLDSARF